MPEERCQVSPKLHYISLALHSDPSPWEKEDFTWYLAAGREQDTVGNEKNSEGSENAEHF